MAHDFQKSRKCHDLPRKLFHFKPPTQPGRAVLGNTGREGRRRKIGVRELAGRKVGGGRREEGMREGGGRGGGKVVFI